MKRNISAIALLFVIIVFGMMSAASSAGAYELVLVTEPNPVLHFQERAPVQVKLLDRSGLPVPDAYVVFRPQSDTADTILSNYEAFTDPNGAAGTSIEAGTEEVDFDILIGVRVGDDIVEPITVHVRVVPTDSGVPEASWPSEEFLSIQDAINALADGGILWIAEGVHNVGHPVYIRNKTVKIAGRGARCKDSSPDAERLTMEGGETGSGTVLVAPHVEGRVPPEESVGTLNFSNGGGSVTGIWFKGGKAGIVGRDIDGAARPLDLSDACVTDTVRGIHWKADAPISVSDTIIRDVEWNGISIAQGALEGVDNLIYDTEVFNAGNFCIAVIGNGIFSGTPVTVEDTHLYNCSGGGIAALDTAITVEDSSVWNSRVAGIWLDHSAGFLIDNYITNTQPRISDGRFGDGISIFLSPFVHVESHFINDSARAGLSNFGSHVEIKNSYFACADYELEGEDYQGVDFSFADLGGNGCGCPIPSGVCVAKSEGIAPPEPSAPIE